MIFLSGLATGLALIASIGSQSAYVLRCGLRGEHVWPIVLFCALADALLISVGISGAGLLIQEYPNLVVMSRYAGALFLASYSLLAVRRTLQGGHLRLDASRGVSLGGALAACFCFTFLNPHVYLDTVVLLGTLANQHGETKRWVYGAGAISASVLWFLALGWGARYLTPWFQTPLAWRLLDGLTAITMGVLSVMLWRA